MSQTHINYNDKYYRELKFSGTGIINTRHTVSLSRKKDQHLSTENTLRVRAEDVNAGNVVELQVKILNETNWTTIGTVTGTETKTFDIRNWDQFRFEVTTYDATSEGVLHVSGFVATLENPSEIGECIKVCDEAGNEITLQLVDGVWTLPVSIEKAPCTPTITNATIAATATIYSHTFTSGAKKFTIKHRDGGNIEFGFTAGLTTYMTIPKGNSLSESDLNIQGVTIYFRSTKTGTLEILEWV